MKVIKWFNYLLIFIISSSSFLYPQNQLNNDSVKIPTQYRRGIGIPPGYQSYEQKYQGKNLQEEKRRLYPLDQITTETGVWTELNPKVPRVTYAGIYFVNKDTGWAVGDLGALIKTTDGGINWSVIETNITTPILKVRSYDGQTVIASGYGGLILRSIDGGESFSQVISGVGNGFDLWGLDMVNDTLGWACGATALLKTTDSGENWQIVNTPGYTGNLWWIDFMNESYGFIAADGKILRTTDSGDSWEIIQAGDNQSLYCVDIIDSLHIAAAGYGGTSYRGKNIYSSDGGYTWITGGPLTFEPINCIKYVNTDTGYAILDEVGLWKTTNRGASWVSLIGNFGEWEIQILNDENIGYGAGSDIRIYKSEGDLDIWHRLFINDNFSDIFFINEQKGFVISSGAYSNYRGLYKTINGGESWQYVSEAPDGVDVLFLDSLTGFIGASSSIYKTTDGGSSWYQTEGTTGAGKIFFINQTTGWAIHSNVIYKTTDRGENWFTQSILSTNFTSIFFLDLLNGWATSSNHYLWETTNGGDNWIERIDLPSYLFASDIYFNGSTGFVANLLELEKTTNGGNSWFTQFASQFIMRTFGWLTNSHGFIMGDGVYETIDSGDNWNENLDLRNIGLRNLQSPASNLGYSSGYLGLIYKYIDTTFISVELVHNSAIVKNNTEVILNWITATETNNKGFEIQRAEAGDQQPVWEKIGFVEGNGTTTQTHFYTFTDKNLSSGKYIYRLKQIDYDGSFEYSKEIEINIEAPNKFFLAQNYPNPFNPETNISFTIPEETNVNLKLYDITGREIKVLVNEKKQPGYYTLKLKGGELSSGVYFYRLTTSSGFTAVKKLILLK